MPLLDLLIPSIRKKLKGKNFGQISWKHKSFRNGTNHRASLWINPFWSCLNSQRKNDRWKTYFLNQNDHSETYFQMVRDGKKICFVFFPKKITKFFFSVDDSQVNEHFWFPFFCESCISNFGVPKKFLSNFQLMLYRWSLSKKIVLPVPFLGIFSIMPKNKAKWNLKQFTFRLNG